MDDRAKIYAGFLSDSAVIRITGHATVLVAPVLKKHLDAYRPQILGKAKLVFDLSDCDFVDSTILGLVSHLSVDYYHANGRFGTLIYSDDKIKKILETLNCNKILEMIYVPPELSTVAAVQEVPGPATLDKNDIRESVAEAHRALVELNEQNAAIFSDVIADLKLPPHS